MNENATPVIKFDGKYRVNEDSFRLKTERGVNNRYGVKAYDRGPTLTEALERMHEIPALLEFEGKLAHHGFVEFDVTFRQAGDSDNYLGFTGWYFTPEDAAYAALTSIEEHEREEYETNLIEGLS